MRKIDHVRKTVYIIVGCLTIVSLVLTICHKVGHCAESSQTSIPYNPLPLYFGSGIGYSDVIPESTILNMVDHCITSCPNYVQGTPVVVTPFQEYGNVKVSVFVVNVSSPPGVVSDYYSTNLFKFNYIYCETYNSIGGSFNVFTNGQFDCKLSEIREQINGNWVYKQGYLAVYPIYIYNYENLYNSNGEQLFAEYGSSTPSIGHTKGGVLANYIDSDELLEDDSQLPSVDVTPPSDPSVSSGWFQKILNGIAKVNQSIKGGVLTIGDYIGQGFENVINWFTEPFDSEQFNSDLNDIALINDFSNLKTQVENCGMFDWSDVTPAQSLSFTFDVGGAVLPHTSCVVDFSWYTGTVKNICVAVICTFLVLGLLVTIINQLPNIIGGKSGDKGGGSDS